MEMVGAAFKLKMDVEWSVFCDYETSWVRQVIIEDNSY